MATRRQILANRRNAHSSTGPITERGRAAVRCNALKHGFYARPELTTVDDYETYINLLTDFTADYRPAGAAETELVQRIVRDICKARRFEAVSLACYSLAAFQDDETVPKVVSEPFARSAYAVQYEFDDQFNRYKPRIPVERYEELAHRLRRAIDASTKLLLRMQADRLRSMPADCAAVSRVDIAGCHLMPLPGPCADAGSADLQIGGIPSAAPSCQLPAEQPASTGSAPRAGSADLQIGSVSPDAASSSQPSATPAEPPPATDIHTATSSIETHKSAIGSVPPTSWNEQSPPPCELPELALADAPVSGS